MERLCTGNARAKRLSTLAQAADCLAKAAVTLSEAARAAAESFSSDLLDITAGIDSLSDDERQDEERTNPEHAEPYLSSNDGEPGEWARSTPVQHETNNTGHYDAEASSSDLITIDQLQFDPNRPPAAASVTTEIETAPGLAYRILVEREADVLLFVCALIQHRRKVICYMNCSIPAFHMYKKFINDVTTTSVYTITKITTAEITEVGRKFLEADRSILLLPETITPSIEIDEVDSWVVHVGWPYDEQRYDEQRRIHQAQNSIVVACSEDEELYLAGAAIMWQSQPWPGDVDSFRVLVALLRPMFVQKLALLPAEMKAKVYPDWISSHGPRGHRYVKSWDASTLVKRANSFLLDVLKYKAPGPKYLGSNPEAFLPEVSEGFVAHNSLELAVEEGVLRVKIPGSGLNHVSSLPTTDWIEPNTSDRRVPKPSKQSKSNSGNTGRRSYVDVALTGSPTEWGQSIVSDWGAPMPNSQLDPNYAKTGRQGYTNAALTGSPSSWSNSAPPQSGIRGRLATNPTPGHSFKSTTGNAYFTIEEEFEAIPLMCFLAANSPSTFRKAVLFFNNSGCQVHYRTLVERITGWRVFTSEDKKNQSSQELGSDFVKCQQPAILLLHFRLRSLPPALENVPLGYCIYWGSTLGGSIQLAQVNKQRAWLNCGSTCLIMTAEQTSKMSPKLNASGFVEHPNSADLHHRHTSPWLSSLRATTSSVLSGEPQLVKGLYEAHLRTLGRNSRFLGAEIIASRMNHFAANVLLAGESKDGSKKYPPLASRPVAPLSVVDECNLQEAVDAGLFMLPKDCHEQQAILLSQATECLAKAAIALSEAAEAIATAAKSFIPATGAGGVSQLGEFTPADARISAIVDYESDSDSSTIENPVTPRKPTNNAQGKQHESNEFPAGITGGDLVLQTAAVHSPITEDAPQAEAEIQPFPPSYRILLDDEADVLLAVCSFIRRGRKVVCYMRSSVTALDVYETLLISVAEVPVHRIKSSSSQELERVVGAFQHDHTSVLLFPATHIPTFRIDEPDSWVIHVGWPTNIELYKQQITHHQAKNNVFVAYSDDQEIYPSSSGILTLARPWPNGELLLKETCTTLRPLIINKLAEIPAKTKAKVYTDWITLHGMRGPYHPPSWTASTLVYRANLYLLDVFKYNTGSTNVSSGAQIALPTVSAGFVTSQNLEAAVEEGVLRVKSSSGLNHISSLPHDAIPNDSIPLNEAEISKPLNSSSRQPTPSPALRSSVGSSWNLESGSGSLNPSSLTHISSRPASRIGSVADSDGNRPAGRVAEYLIIDFEIDIIPSICYLSMQPKHKNTILFVKSLGTFEALVGLLQKMVVKPVFPLRGNGPLSKGVKEALDSSGCLLLCDMYSDRPPGLNNKLIDLAIHLDWVNDPSISQSQTRQASNIVLLSRREVQDPNWPDLAASIRRMGISKASPSTKRDYNQQTENSILAPCRNQFIEMLSSSPAVQNIRSAYMAWITHHFHGRHKEPGWTAVNVATHANSYFRGLFCYGSDGDMLQDRPMVTRGFVKHLGLEAAVAAGLLTVKE